MTETKEFEIINHVIKHAKYHSDLQEKPYVVHWKGKLYSAKDTMDLVIQINKAEGI